MRRPKGERAYCARPATDRREGPADPEKPARKGRVGIGVRMTLVSKTFDLFGKTYVLEAGELAKQATGAALVKQGDSTVLTTVVVSKERKNYDFFPLTVDFNEKMYAAGRIPASATRSRSSPPPSWPTRRTPST